MEYPEQLSLSLPSSFGRELIEVHGLQMLASQEIQLRVGQANDMLGDLLVELGHKTLLFRIKIRYTKNMKGKTRCSKVINGDDQTCSTVSTRLKGLEGT